MTRAATPPARFMQRLLLTAMLGLALASRLALGATVPTGMPADASSALAHLQAVMVMCDPGQTPKVPPPSPDHATSFDDLIVLDAGDNALALPGVAASLPPVATRWIAADRSPATVLETPLLYRAAPQPRGPPALL
ncbi:hypothetical protein [Acidisoma silvae]|uniref:Uncharacterized protein n=1 Tax=Acidisoma silvae TaxID=2802396 RepID=A0A963YPU4_9PROT|nr:hypothetical protein [Acidisoma silvae]MCB8874612.1 hypothetical protein [Acidisoma silvae]